MSKKSQSLFYNTGIIKRQKLTWRWEEILLRQPARPTVDSITAKAVINRFP